MSCLLVGAFGDMDAGLADFIIAKIHDGSPSAAVVRVFAYIIQI